MNAPRTLRVVKSSLLTWPVIAALALVAALIVLVHVVASVSGATA